MIKFFKTRLAARRQKRDTIRELSVLSNRELADLGIGRGEIPFVADGSPLLAGEVFVAVAAGEAFVAVAARKAPTGPAPVGHAPTSLAA